MQSEASTAFDIQREPLATRRMYGKGAFARQALIARRLVERGVRFVQLYTGAGQPWDSHDDLETAHRGVAKGVGGAIGALYYQKDRITGIDTCSLGRRIRQNTCR